MLVAKMVETFDASQLNRFWGHESRGVLRAKHHERDLLTTLGQTQRCQTVAGFRDEACLGGRGVEVVVGGVTCCGTMLRPGARWNRTRA